MIKQPMEPEDLAATVTLIKEFMGDPSEGCRTFDSLLTIYNQRKGQIDPERDRHGPRDLRIDEFEADMLAGRWTDDINLVLGQFDSQVVVIDGVHRGIAYLSCIARGADPDTLPKIYVEKN